MDDMRSSSLLNVLSRMKSPSGIILPRPVMWDQWMKPSNSLWQVGQPLNTPPRRRPDVWSQPPVKVSATMRAMFMYFFSYLASLYMFGITMEVNTPYFLADSLMYFRARRYSSRP